MQPTLAGEIKVRLKSGLPVNVFTGQLAYVGSKILDPCPKWIQEVRWVYIVDWVQIHPSYWQVQVQPSYWWPAMMSFKWKTAQIQKLTGKQAKNSKYPEAMNSHSFCIRLSDYQTIVEYFVGHLHSAMLTSLTLKSERIKSFKNHAVYPFLQCCIF